MLDFNFNIPNSAETFNSVEAVALVQRLCALAELYQHMFVTLKTTHLNDEQHDRVEGELHRLGEIIIRELLCFQKKGACQILPKSCSKELFTE